MRHDPVLFSEVIEYLRPVTADGILVDATLGLGGHAEGLLERYPDVRLIGIDRDQEAIDSSAGRLERFGDRVVLVCGRHESLIDILEQQGVSRIDGLLADLGVSSLQLDRPDRGFSFRHEGPLDMRMGGEGETAAGIVNRAEESELAIILRRYGEEPMAGRIARAIVAARLEAPIETTTRLAEVIRSVKKPGRQKIDPATQSFQAIRIAVNQELVGLEQFLDAAVARLKVGARVAVISFHSLEDRIVKRLFRRLEGECSCPPGLPVCRCGARRLVKVLTRRAAAASEAEQERNPRSRSARLRVAERVE